jgi:hypothetical protein
VYIDQWVTLRRQQKLCLYLVYWSTAICVIYVAVMIAAVSIIDPDGALIIDDPTTRIRSPAHVPHRRSLKHYRSTLRPRYWQRHPQALANGRRDSTKEARGSDRLLRRRLRLAYVYVRLVVFRARTCPNRWGLQSPESTVQTAICQTA